MGILNWTNYQFVSAIDVTATTVDDLDTGTFILACDFESYTVKSGALLSGRDLYLNAIFASSATAVIDVFLHYDVKLIIKDGILSLNV